MKQNAIKKQQGVVLIWALAILLVLTILGVSSMKKANMGTSLAGNSMASMMVYQGAESGLGRVANTYSTKVAEKIPYNVPQNILPNESVSGGNIRSTAVVTNTEEVGPCPVTNVAMSVGSKCVVFRFEVESRLQGTGAKTVHFQGNARLHAPAPHFTN